jgi:pSer/pThr/pTyr-binding forkhead associated (FHA) protein
MPDDTKIPNKDEKKPEGALPSNLKVYIEVLEGPEAGKKFELKKLHTTIGRKNCDIILNDPTISGKHCSIEVGRDDILLFDNNSTNGTFVNGEQCASCPLQNLDEIKIGESKMLFSLVSDPYAIYQEPGTAEIDKQTIGRPVSGTDEQTATMDGGLFNPGLPEGYQAVLEVLSGPNKGQRFKLTLRSTVIGRKASDIVLTDESVSQRHAQIEVHSKDKITIKDLASTNGTRVNGALVSAVKIRNEDEIELGQSKMKFYFRAVR